MQGNKIVLNLGFSHSVEMDVPTGLKAVVENNTSIIITGADKQLLGQFASEIRSKRPPEPFKGKGVKYAESKLSAKKAKRSKEQTCLKLKNYLSVAVNEPALNFTKAKTNSRG